MQLFESQDMQDLHSSGAFDARISLTLAQKLGKFPQKLLHSSIFFGWAQYFAQSAIELQLPGSLNPDFLAILSGLGMSHLKLRHKPVKHSSSLVQGLSVMPEGMSIFIACSAHASLFTSHHALQSMGFFEQ